MPDGWGVQTIMGLTDPKGKMIYLADGLDPKDAMETLLHEFVHLEGHDDHDEHFYQRFENLCLQAGRKRVAWDCGI